MTMDTHIEHKAFWRRDVSRRPEIDRCYFPGGYKNQLQRDGHIRHTNRQVQPQLRA